MSLTSVKLKPSGSDRWNHLFTEGILSSTASDWTSCRLEIAASPHRAPKQLWAAGPRVITPSTHTSEWLKCPLWFPQDSEACACVSVCVQEGRGERVSINIYLPPLMSTGCHLSGLFIFRSFISLCRRYESALAFIQIHHFNITLCLTPAGFTVLSLKSVAKDLWLYLGCEVSGTWIRLEQQKKRGF